MKREHVSVDVDPEVYIEKREQAVYKLIKTDIHNQRQIDSSVSEVYRL